MPLSACLLGFVIPERIMVLIHRFLLIFSYRIRFYGLERQEVRGEYFLSESQRKNPTKGKNFRMDFAPIGDDRTGRAGAGSQKSARQGRAIKMSVCWKRRDKELRAFDRRQELSQPLKPKGAKKNLCFPRKSSKS